MDGKIINITSSKEEKEIEHIAMQSLFKLRYTNHSLLERLCIRNVFHKKNFDDFVEYCNNRSIIFMNQLECVLIDDFKNDMDKNNSKKIMSQIYSRIVELEKIFNKDFFELEYLKIHHSQDLKSTNIRDVFNDKKYLLFNLYCESSQIITMDDLDSNSIIVFLFSKNIGIKKYEDVHNRIHEFLIDLIGDDEREYIFNYIRNVYPMDLEEKEIDTIFKDSRHVALRIFCSDRNINNLLDLDCSLQKQFLNLYDTNDTKKRSFMNILKSVYIGIIKENSNLNKTIRDSYFFLDSTENKKIRDAYFKLVSIDDIFNEEYKAFQNIKEKLCEDGIDNLYDLCMYDKTILKNLSSVGNKRYSEFKLILDKKIQDATLNANIIYKGKFNINEDILGVIGDYEVDRVVSILDISEEYNEVCGNKLIDYIGCKYKDIDSFDLIKKLIDIKTKIDMITNFSEFVYVLNFEKYSDLEKEVLYKAVLSDADERDIALANKKSILEIRRILKYLSIDINRKIEEYRLELFLRLISPKIRNKKIDCLENIVKDEVIIRIIKANLVSGVFYDRNTDKIFVTSSDEEMEVMSKSFENIPNFGEISFIKEIIKGNPEIYGIEEGFDESMEMKLYNHILEKNNIRIYGDYYFKINMSKIDVFEFFLRYFHKEPFRVCKENVGIYNDFLLDIGMNYSVNPRSVDGIKIRNKNLILVAPRTFTHIDLLDIDEVTQFHIKKILDRMLLKDSIINARDLYNIVKEYYPDSIRSKHHLYSLVFYYFDEYQSSTGNSLDISKKGVSMSTKTDEIYNLCKDNGSIISIKEILRRTKWNMNRVYNTIDNSEDVIKLGPSKCVIIEDILTEDIRDNIIRCTNEAIAEGYCFSFDLYNNYIKKDLILCDFVSKYKISNHKEIASVVKYVCDDVVGNNNLLYKKNSSIKSLEDIVSIKYPKKFSKHDLIGFLEHNGYSKISVYQTIGRLQSKKMYIRISADDYESVNYFDLDKSVVDCILETADKKIQEDGFFVPNKHIDEVCRCIKESKVFDEYKYSPNQFIISGVLEYNGYIKLTRYKKNNNEDVDVIVAKKSKYRDIDVLVYDILKEKYNGSLMESDVYDYLSSLGIYKEIKENTNKKLQKDIYVNGLIHLNHNGEIMLK